MNTKSVDKLGKGLDKTKVLRLFAEKDVQKLLPSLISYFQTFVHYALLVG